jgi:hypothetical protein
LPKDFNEKYKEIKNKLKKEIKETEEAKNYINIKGIEKHFKKEPERIKIKHARLDEDNYLLEINNGEKIISFKSKKKIKKGLDLENHLTKEQEEELKKEEFKTKQFKILAELWRFKWEKVSGKVREVSGGESDYTTLENLAKYAQCPSIGAGRRHIYRLNTIFKKENVPIEIEIKNNKTRLIIEKS